MEKAEGAFLTISELSGELGLPQHILRYWETRFPQLRPLQRSGNRRYYRPADVALVRRINHLLNVEGFTVRGAQKALADGSGTADQRLSASPPPVAAPVGAERSGDLLERLQAIRAALASAIGD
ncbi:MerR family transcriptional regulator [Sphingobium sp. EP60837]|jgi:DNA-binding transcriptional MerR regulator|uniref:MerR family transcriptional regulator n=1 Tax=Sphingobium sp. EP60837 TaxID=1855519 RepID=UPI0007DDD49D|nr:MerR family transcriptional regulator [Sphingobium sp. EP60837]ANI78239.1 putative HTH-type transcriptional regulator in himA 3'region [Sphingobium sp. EP60837]